MIMLRIFLWFFWINVNAIVIFVAWTLIGKALKIDTHLELTIEKIAYFEGITLMCTILFCIMDVL